MSGCRGCVGEHEELCLSLDHHPGDAVEQPSGWETKNTLFYNFNICFVFSFSQAL